MIVENGAPMCTTPFDAKPPTVGSEIIAVETTLIPTKSATSISTESTAVTLPAPKLLPPPPLGFGFRHQLYNTVGP